MRALLDTNIVLDVLLNRQPWVQAASQIWQAIDDNKIAGYLSACTLTDIFYIAHKLTGREKAAAAVSLCLKAFEICAVDRQVLMEAQNLPNPDFEDNVQIASAAQAGIDCIITRDPAGFEGATIPVMSSDDFVKTYLNQ